MSMFSESPAEASAKGLFSSLVTNAKSLAQGAKKAAQEAGGVMNETFLAGAETLGFKDQVEAVEKAVGRVGKDAKAARNRAVNKARRFANRALDFDEEDESLDSSDYDLLLSAAGATDKSVPIHSIHQHRYTVPMGSAFVWKARVKKSDIGFAIKVAREGHEDVEIEPMTRYRSDATISGQLQATAYTRDIILVFDNATSLQPKRVVYWVAIGENVSLADDTLGAARSKEVKAAEAGPRDD